MARQSAEFVVGLVLSVLLFRTFAAEAYVVPTGSMAPTLLGVHREIGCPNCGYRFTLGLDESGRSGRAVCPNCGQGGLDEANAVESQGDRVLVQKFLYDLRRPRRWEVAVFSFPQEPSQAYVKRVVGLPGESVRIERGDIYVDGAIARKTLAEQRALRLPVFDNHFVPKDSARYPRWTFRRGRPEQHLPSGWKAEGTTFVRAPQGAQSDRVDWLEYRHWEPDRNRYTAVRDFNAYNGAEFRGENVVTDLMLSARVKLGPDVRSLLVRIDSGADRFVVEVPIGDREGATVLRRGKPLALRGAGRGFVPKRREAFLEVSVMDRRLSAAVDGVPLFEPFDYDDPAVGVGPGDSPIAVGTREGTATLSDLRIYRDIYYTGSLALTPRRAFAVDAPYQLGPDEFFVLGDNSAVSNDSRFWPGSPVVPGELFLGKPFLVHLPGQAVPLEVFGGSPYWVPDPREIRYIR